MRGAIRHCGEHASYAPKCAECWHAAYGAGRAVVEGATDDNYPRGRAVPGIGPAALGRQRVVHRTSRAWEWLDLVLLVVAGVVGVVGLIAVLL